MKKLPILLLVLALVSISWYFYAKRSTVDSVPTPQAETPVLKEASFEWIYTYSSKSDIPRTGIDLRATYRDGTTETKHVDDIEGGCNEYEEKDRDTYPKSQMIICYYAGLGRYYKVVKQEHTYLVQRKEFEEASPDYSPPKQEFQTIAEF